MCLIGIHYSIIFEIEKSKIDEMFNIQYGMNQGPYKDPVWIDLTIVLEESWHMHNLDDNCLHIYSKVVK